MELSTVIYQQHLDYNFMLRKVYNGVFNSNLSATFILELYAKESVALRC